ncbi:formate dehydrogenase [Reticulibacter mediterranei]|uniref:Formate dehydrogenase n=1 Tax=Reticulibacter mediterranei TaxID=2778369 RepID=A0A8J3N2T2_9CHLR|nr:FdhF/YdeP family oxidoreductase [Reticulibacter mediterranei]GHO92462.1 formate dehydrogenase [Reticulibacter mediterranei]
MAKRFLSPTLWAGWKPFGIGETKPHHFLEIFKTIWQNKRHPLYAWRILNQGCCDGCALGTTGMRDWTMDGIHLCTIRLNLLQLNTMSAMPWQRLENDLPALSQLSSAQLRQLGRLPYPMVRRRGESGFRRVSWNDALDIIASRIRETQPERLAFYLTSRGLTNEVYYVAQKVARFLGTNNVDNAARVCHSPSSVALKQTVGVGASSVSYQDWIGTDLIVFLGSDVANNQPVSTKYLYYAKQAGTKIALVNPYREPGLMRYWVPSVPESAVMGTKLLDAFYQITVGGDIAFLNGTLKHLIEQDWVNHEFIEAHTTGWEEVAKTLAAQDWEMLERASGSTRDEMFRFAEMIHAARTGILVWSMGITQHAFGVQNVKAIVNIALSQGWLGKEHCGVVPIRGHSGVQGGAEVGAVPDLLPGGAAVNAENSARFKEIWGFDVPTTPGLRAVEMIDAAYDGNLDILYCSGGNFLEVLPDPQYVREALEKPALRVHQDIYVTSQMLIDPADTVVLLPAQTRYEQRGGGTETSTERRIIFSPTIPGPRVGEARSEWEIFQDLAARVSPEKKKQITFSNAQAIREEIGRVVPTYKGIAELRKAGDQIQYGGRVLYRDGQFKTPDGKGHFSALVPPERNLPPGKFLLATRRGKQFNSLIYAKKDAMTGTGRDSLLISPEDATSLSLSEGDRVLVKSDNGATMQCSVHIDQVQPRTVQAFWPECNVLIRRRTCDVQAGVPDYNAIIEIEPLRVPQAISVAATAAME